MQLVKVVWWDAHSNDPWHDAETPYIQMVVTSVGFITDENLELAQEQPPKLDSGITIQPNRCDSTNPQAFGTVYIPRGCIKSVEILQYDKELIDESETTTAGD